MSLSSLQLDAFAAVVKHRSFSLAAQALHITQSALSQRILNLEEELESSLLIRDPKGVRLSELGERLLRYCQTRKSIEEEFLSDLRSTDKSQLGGILRVAGFSTITRSIILPTLTGLTQKHPKIQLEITTAELNKISDLLESGEVDFAFSNQAHPKQGIQSQLVGHEENVLIRSKQKKSTHQDRFLDHDAQDLTTFDFFKAQSKKPKNLQRHFLDEIYAILDGVAEGLGQAVVPKHLIQDMRSVEVVADFKPVRSPVYLLYFDQPYFTQLQKAVIQLFIEEFSERLGAATKSR